MFYPEPKQKNLDKLFVIHSGFMVSVRPQWKVRMNIDMVSFHLGKSFILFALFIEWPFICKVHRAFFPTGDLANILYAKYGEDMNDRRNWPAMAKDIRMIRVEADYYKTPEGRSLPDSCVPFFIII